MQNETLFIVLDTIMMTICTGLQTFVHPGIFFPAMATSHLGEGSDGSLPEYKESAQSLEPVTVPGPQYTA